MPWVFTLAYLLSTDRATEEESKRCVRFFALIGSLLSGYRD